MRLSDKEFLGGQLHDVELKSHDLSRMLLVPMCPATFVMATGGISVSTGHFPSGMLTYLFLSSQAFGPYISIGSTPLILPE